MATIRVPLFNALYNRRAGKTTDIRLLNGYVEQLETGELEVVKRPGISVLSEEFPSGIGRGMYNWNGRLIVGLGDRVYLGVLFGPGGQFDSFLAGGMIGGSLLGGNTLAELEETGTQFFELGQVGSGTEELSFAETDGGNLFISDGINLFKLEQNETFTQLTDADIPSPHIRSVQWIDGHIVLMNDKGEIYNSGVDGPEDWDALDFLTAEFEADTGVALSKHLNYLVAHGSRSTEFFVNQGLQPPGSPFVKVQQQYLPWGCASAQSVWQGPETLTWVARDRAGGYFVACVNNLQPSRISTPTIDRMLASSGPGISEVRGYGVRINGHIFYILSLLSRTLVYDFVEETWHEWGTGNGKFVADTGSIEYQNSTLLQDSTTGNIYSISSNSTSDDGEPIIFKLVTDKFDASPTESISKSFKVKFMDRLEVDGDTNYVTPVIATIRWSDDDYKTWSTPRNIDLSRGARLTRLGKFRERAFEFISESDSPIRVKSLEVKIREGGYS